MLEKNMETEVKPETKESNSDNPEISKNNSVTSEPVENKLDEEKEAIKKKATLLFLQGKRSIFIKDFQAAATALSDSCQLFSTIYSQQDDVFGDLYFYYGKALLEVARSESEVLGDQMQEEKDEDESSDDENDDENNDEKEQDSNDENMEKKENNSDSNVTNSFNEQNSVKSPKSQSCETNDAKQDVKVNKELEDSLDDKNDDVNDLQLSWEYLELAKLIYLRKSDTCKETAVKLAETYLCLGENGLESENYSTAIEDINQALKLQKKHLKEEDRRIAETYYQLGMAYSLDQNYDEAIESFRKAIDQLKKKITSLEFRKKVGDSKTKEEEKDAFYTMDGEINEIKVVIKDIDEKIKDMLECKSQVKAELVKQVYGTTQEGLGVSSAGDGKSIPAASDISHLVRKKRKNPEDDEHQEKKIFLEN